MYQICKYTVTYHFQGFMQYFIYDREPIHYLIYYEINVKMVWMD